MTSHSIPASIMTADELVIDHAARGHRDLFNKARSVIRIRNKSIKSDRIKHLDFHLIVSSMAVVEQAISDGKYFYRVADDGTYTVRIQNCAPLEIDIVQELIDYYDFEIVGEQCHD